MLWALACGAGAALADDAAQARELLDLAGVRAGVCIHLDCGRTGSAGLSAALATARPRLVVHGLALTEEARARAAAAVESSGCLGRVVVEKIPVSPLPYYDNYANLLVVEDAAAMEKAGVDEAEMLRVLAPGGVLCRRSSGKWKKVVKPWPPGMDDWPMARHDAGGTRVSLDERLTFPLAYRWLEGLPSNMREEDSHGSTMGLVLAGGRCFSLTATDPENLDWDNPRHQFFVQAHDAFSGVPLWKFGTQNWYGPHFTDRMNLGPLASDGERVYTAQGASLVILDAATGEVLHATPTRHKHIWLAPLLADGLVVVNSWASRVAVLPGPRGMWTTFSPTNGLGCLEAFDSKTGQPRWAFDGVVRQFLIGDGHVYAQMDDPAAPTTNFNVTASNIIVAINLKDGKEVWRTRSSDLPLPVGPYSGVQIKYAGGGAVVVASDVKGFYGLSAEDGHMLWKTGGNTRTFAPVIHGQIWMSGRKYDVKTGIATGGVPACVASEWVSPGACNPMVVLGDRFLGEPLNAAWYDLKAPPPPAGKSQIPLKFFGQRGPCTVGYIPGYGMLFSGHIDCKCFQGMPLGFVASGPAVWVKPEAFAAARPIEKGAAFGAGGAAGATAADWPTYRGNAERSAWTEAEGPAALGTVWKTPTLLTVTNGALWESWTARLFPPVSAPVAAQGRAFVSVFHEGRIVALDLADGHVLWSVTLPGRVDSPPTIFNDLALVGCHDGWVYALRATDGVLAWRTRAAPAERRMTAYAEIESAWPAMGSVLVQDGVAYASAGRSTECESGIALLALNPKSGQMIWGTSIGTGTNAFADRHLNDLLRMRGSLLSMHTYQFVAETGKQVEFAPNPNGRNYMRNGILEGSFIRNGTYRRGGVGFVIGRLADDVMAWNREKIVTPKGAITQEKAAIPPPVPAEPGKPARSNLDGWGAPRQPDAKDFLWCGKRGPVRAVVVAGKTAYMAGGAKDFFVQAYAVEGGAPGAAAKLAAEPIYDGMAVANGTVLVTLWDGSVACLGGSK